MSLYDDGPTWDAAGLQRDFRVLAFAAPFVVVERIADGVRGTLEFTHRPRVYFALELFTTEENQPS